MTQKYETETGYYIIRDSAGEILGFADVPIGTHPITDEADLSKCEDID